MILLTNLLTNNKKSKFKNYSHLFKSFIISTALRSLSGKFNSIVFAPVKTIANVFPVADLFRQYAFVVLFLLTGICTRANIVSQLNANRIRTRGNSITPQSFTSNLYAVQGNELALVDGNLAEYDNSFSAGVDNIDAPKFENFDETFALLRDGKLLVIERRPIITNADTLFFDLTKTTQRTYLFQFITTQLNHPGLQGFLKDSYTGDSATVDLNGTTTYTFNVNADAASQSPTRFMVVFEIPPPQASPVPVTFTGIKAFEQGSKIPVLWTVQNESNIQSYIVQKSTDDKTFEDIATIPAAGTIQYSWTDINIATDNYYRIESIGKDGAIQYSLITQVTIMEVPAIKLYPNPATGNVIKVQFTNMPKGIYSIKLLTTLGQTVAEKTVDYKGDSVAQTITVNNSIKGIYEIEIIKPGGGTVIYNAEYR